MGIKLHILSLACILITFPLFASEKFLKISGTILEEESRSPLSDYSIRVVEDKLDSTDFQFTKSEFVVWAPSNLRSTVYFLKDGYVTKHIFIDASYIPSIAYKEKQEIKVEILMTPTDKIGRRKFNEPIITAKYEAASNSFKITIAEQTSTTKVAENYNPPFPAPVDTYKGVQPSVSDLALTTSINKEKLKITSDHFRIVQGILFADINYCMFNERTNDANEILKKLAEIDPQNWADLKPIDSPEYGKIVMRTLNREQSIDTLFALGVFVETSRLIFENFTSDTKILVHLKKLKEVMNAYKPQNLKSGQINLVNALKMMIPLISDLETKYTESLRNKTDFDLSTDGIFLQIKMQNLETYRSIVD